MVAGKEDTNVSPSCPVFLLNSPGAKVLLILRLAQPSPQTSPFPTATSAICGARIPEQKGTCSSWCCRKAAVPSCLGSGKAGRLLGGAASQAAPQRRVSQVCRQSSQGCGQGLQLEYPPSFAARGWLASPSSNRVPSPASFPRRRGPLLTLIPRQETAPCSQPNPLLGRGGCNAGSQPPGFTGLAGKAPPASLLQIQLVPPLHPLPEAPGFHSVGGSR